MHTSDPPLTVESLDSYLDRRRRSGLALSPGETVTLTVALLRDTPPPAPTPSVARWALTADGRPVLIVDAEGDDLPAASERLLDEVAALSDEGVRPLIESARAALVRPRSARGDIEQRLFARAVPCALVLGPLSPRLDPEEPPVQRDTIPPFLALLDADMVATALDAFRSLRGRLSGGRRRVVIVAAVVACVAVVLGLGAPRPGVEPTPIAEAASPASANSDGPPAGTVLIEPGLPFPRVSETSAPSPTPSTPAADAETDDDLVTIARALLTSYAACAGSATCESGLREGEPTVGEPRPIDPREADVTLVDDFGGLAVVRVEAEDEQQYVTLVRATDRWLVRAVRTVADQPS